MSFPRSGTVDTQTFSGTKDLVFARLSSGGQAANIAANDHIKFDVVDFSRPDLSSTTGAAGSNSISLDTTSTYSNAAATASVGRFSLKGGKVYKLTYNPQYVLFSGATGLLTVQFYDVTSVATAIGQMLSVYAQTDASNDGSVGQLNAFYSAAGSSGDISLVEVRIVTATALTSIGSSTKGLPTVLVETY